MKHEASAKVWRVYGAHTEHRVYVIARDVEHAEREGAAQLGMPPEELTVRYIITTNKPAAYIARRIQEDHQRCEREARKQSQTLSTEPPAISPRPTDSRSGNGATSTTDFTGQRASA